MFNIFLNHNVCRGVDCASGFAKRSRPAKKGCGIKRARKALLIIYELVKYWLKSSAKLRKEMETGKQSGVAFPAGPCRVGEARPQKHTKTKQKSYIMLQISCSSSSLALRLRLRRRCAAHRGVEMVYPCRASEERARKQQSRHTMLIRRQLCLQTEVQAFLCSRADAERLGYFRSVGRGDFQKPQIVLPRRIYDMATTHCNVSMRESS
jgi:hypothetical protein